MRRLARIYLDSESEVMLTRKDLAFRLYNISIKYKVWTIIFKAKFKAKNVKN